MLWRLGFMSNPPCPRPSPQASPALAKASGEGSDPVNVGLDEPPTQDRSFLLHEPDARIGPTGIVALVALSHGTVDTYSAFLHPLLPRIKIGRASCRERV